MPKTLYLIDGHAQIYRAYYAPFQNLTSPTGEPTRATHVFFQMLLNLLRDRRPDYLAMVLDADETKLQRRALYPAYKAQREPSPEDLHPQVARIIEILTAARVPLLQHEGFEADDLIATLVERLAHPDLEIVIVSRDKDLDQLLRPGVCLYDPMSDKTLTAETLFAEKGWHPHQAIDAQTLTGDTTDNVPGVHGIGPKKAAALLQKYGTAAAVMAHADELTPKQRENVLAFAPLLERTRQLVTLVRDVPLEFELATAATARFAWSAVATLFSELGFRRLREQLPHSSDPVTIPAAQCLPEAAITTETIADATPATELRLPDGGEYVLVNTPERFAELVAALRAQPEFAFDTETTSIQPVDCDLVGLSFSWEVGRGYYVPVRSVYGPVLPQGEVLAALAPLFADVRVRKVGQNLKYDLNVLRGAGLCVAGPLFDTMIAAFLCDPGRLSFGMDRLAFDLFGHAMIPITDLIGKGRQQLRMDQVPLEHIAEYAAEDADYTWRLRQHYAPRLAVAGVAELFSDTEMPLVRVLADMEWEGVALDVPFLEELARRLAARVEELGDEVHAAAGQTFNLDSPKQLAEVLFDKLGYRVVRMTKTSRSTDADTLEILGRENPQASIFSLLLEYRELQKLRGTYVDALPRSRAQRTGRVHTSYHQTGAVTGRLSSSEPNLQNIPIRTPLGREVRRAFVPRTPEERLIVADYSQVELRVLAHYSGDEALRQAFVEDRDIHAVVAAQVNHIALEEVTSEQRSRAKAVNFGIVYGQTAFGLAQTTGMERGAAQAFIDAYFARYPRIRAFMDACIADAKRAGGVRTLLGRWRPIENLDSRNPTIRGQAERFAVNTVIQGSAADLIKTAMLRLHERIARDALPLRMLLQVHDELVCEAPAAAAERLSGVVREVMSGALPLNVPLKVDVACGKNWLEAK